MKNKFRAIFFASSFLLSSLTLSQAFTEEPPASNVGASQMVLFPSKTASWFTLNVSGAQEGDYTFKVLDKSGKVVQSGSFTKKDRVSQKALNVAGLTQGSYTVEVVGGNENLNKTLIKL